MSKRNDWVGAAMVARLLSLRANVDISDVEKVLTEFGSLIEELANQGKKIKPFPLGHFEVVNRAPRKMVTPHGIEAQTEGGPKVVFRTARKTTGEDEPAV